MDKFPVNWGEVLAGYLYQWLFLSGVSIPMAVVCACLIKAYHWYRKKNEDKMAAGFVILCATGAGVFIFLYSTPFLLYCGLFMLFYHFRRSPEERRAPSYTLLWCVAYSFLFTPVLLFSKLSNDPPF